MDSPPLFITGIEDIGEHGSSVTVIDCNCGPSCP
jgi:hypothetical protein